MLLRGLDRPRRFETLEFRPRRFERLEPEEVEDEGEDEDVDEEDEEDEESLLSGSLLPPLPLSLGRGPLFFLRT